MVKVFSTQFPLKDSTSLDDLLEVGKKWITKSPNYSDGLKSDVESFDKGNYSVEKGKEKVELRVEETSQGDFLGLRLSAYDRGTQWVSTLVGEKKERDFDVYIDVNCYSDVAGRSHSSVKKPYLVRLLLNEIEGGRDGSLLVSDSPIYLRSNDEPFIAEILLGKNRNVSVMPIVYLSRDFNDEILLDEKRLAEFLSGVAHVLVEPSRKFSLNLKREMKSRNVFGGAIGIYWPEIKGREFWLPGVLDRVYGGKIVYNKLLEGLVIRNPRKTLTWENLKDIETSRKIRDLKERDSKTAEEYEGIVKLYEKEKKSLEAENARLRGEASSLSNRVQILSSRSSEDFLAGEEFYPGENQEIVRRALENYYANHKNGRVGKKIIGFLKNMPSQDSRKKIEAKLKSIFGLRDIQKIKRELKKLGFRARNDGGHPKIYLPGNPNIFSTLPKTPSDRREWENAFSDFMKVFF